MRKLKLLFAIAALMLGVGGAWAYQTPVADGIYYLYNTGCTNEGSKGFLSSGCGYGVQAVIDNYGYPVKLIDAGDGNYKFQFIHHEGYFADDGWMYTDGNTSRARTITIQDQGNGNYKLYNTNNSKWIETWWNGTLNGYAVVGDGTENRSNYIWQFLSKEERDAIIAGYTKDQKLAAATSMGITLGEQTAEAFDAYISENFIGIDQSSKIQNGTFDTSHNTEGWTLTANPNRGFAIGWGNADPKTTPEIWQGAGSISQTITVDQAGLYKVSVNAFYRCGNGDNNNRIGNLGYDGSVAYLKANDNFVKISDWYSGKIDGNGPGSPSQANSAYFANGKYLNEVYVYVGDTKTIEISLHTHAYMGNCWMAFNHFKLTYYSDQVSDEDATAILAEATSLENGIMQASVQSALSSAKSNFNGSRTIANYNALSAAITNANASVTAYANAKEYLDKMGAILEGTNVYTQEAYNQYYGTWLSGYNAKTLETATAEGLNANIAYSTGWHSNNYVDDILLSTWTFGGEQCSNYDKDLYINTWSVEGNTDGSEFYTPFFEYWVSSGSLKPNTLVSTITGLKANTTYSFTIRARVQGTTEKIANGITMKVGEGTAVDISAGAQFNGGNFYIGNFSAVGQTDAEGKLVTTITVAENSNISWLSFYNCKYTEGEDLSAYIADYEFALDNVNTALTNDVAYDAMQTDLKAAATTYAKGSVDETSKTALIAAKEALEAALAAYYEIVGPLKGNNISKWTTTGNNGSFQVNTWSGEGNSDGSNMKTPFTQNWINRGTNLTDATMSYTVEGLTPGYYRVTALIRSLNEAGGATPAGSFIFANDAIERAYGTNSSVCTNGVYGNPVVYGLVGEDGKLTIGVKIIKANVNWVAWKNFIYTYEGTELTQAIADNLTEEARTFANTGADAAVAQTDAISALSTLSDANYTAAGQAIEAAYKAIDRDFTTLKEALAAVAAGTLGFEVGEFAPYNTIAAKAIDQTSEANTQAEIDEAAAICVANAVEVNAFYDGDFSECAEDNASPLDYTPAGWTASENFRMMLKDTETYPGLADASIPSAVFTWSGGVTYGEQAGYEMPLKANTVYTLKFKAAGWENQTRSGMTVSILNGNDGMAAYNLGTPDRDIKGNEHNTAGMTSYEYVFATGAAGNYVFHIQSGNNMVMTDFEIKKAASQELAFADNAAMPKYAPGTYPTVKVSRTLTENNWATAVYPFEVSKEDVGNIAVLDSYDSENNEVGFSTVLSSKANEPFLMKSSATKSEIVLSNVEVAEAKAANAVLEPLSFIGVYTQTEVEQGADVKNFVLKDNTIYRIGENAATLNPYRAYFQVAQPVEQARLSFFIDGQQTTGLSEELRVKGQEFATAPVYNLNGQRVEKPNKGLYISNGKKVVLK